MPATIKLLLQVGIPDYVQDICISFIEHSIQTIYFVVIVSSVPGFPIFYLLLYFFDSLKHNHHLLQTLPLIMMIIL